VAQASGLLLGKLDRDADAAATLRKEVVMAAVFNQDPPEVLSRMMEAMDQGADVVYAHRPARRNANEEVDGLHPGSRAPIVYREG
jgi:enamine deaminase RidA (YjgF/YER057c/UK114 family)